MEGECRRIAALWSQQSSRSAAQCPICAIPRLPLQNHLEPFFWTFSLHDIFCRTVYIPVMRCTLWRLADIMANPQEMINLLMRKYLSFLWQKYVSLHWLVLCTCRSKVQIWIIFKERFMERRNLPMRIYLTLLSSLCGKAMFDQICRYQFEVKAKKMIF